MSEEVVIRVSEVSKSYRIFDRPQDRLKELLFGRFRAWHRDFWALQELSFDIRRGESVGLIGRNGSGKSTLLQLIAGTLQPTSGGIDVHGRIGALLELGSGFNPEFTGRENVFLNAAIIGMGRRQIEERFGAIVDFSELADFIDQPVKTYSSGMFMRLAFAVQAFTDPNVLIIDEALAVGDVFFQQKCFKHLHALRESGVTLLVVSHDMGTVRNVCTRALLLHGGHLLFDGPPEEAASRYYSVPDRSQRAGTLNAARTGGEVLKVEPELRGQILRADILARARGRHGVGGLHMLAARFLNEHGDDSFEVEMLRTATLRVLVQAESDVPAPSVGLHLFDSMGNLVFAAGSRQLRIELAPLRRGDEMAIELRLSLQVGPGLYTFNLGCSEPSVEGPNVGVIHDRVEGLGPIRVHADDSGVLPFYGIARLPLEIERLA